MMKALVNHESIKRQWRVINIRLIFPKIRQDQPGVSANGPELIQKDEPEDSGSELTSNDQLEGSATVQTSNDEPEDSASGPGKFQPDKPQGSASRPELI